MLQIQSFLGRLPCPGNSACFLCLSPSPSIFTSLSVLQCVPLSISVHLPSCQCLSISWSLSLSLHFSLSIYRHFSLQLTDSESCSLPYGSTPLTCPSSANCFSLPASTGHCVWSTFKRVTAPTQEPHLQIPHEGQSVVVSVMECCWLSE